MSIDLSPYLRVTDIIDWQNPHIIELAQSLAAPYGDRSSFIKERVGEQDGLPYLHNHETLEWQRAIAKASFEWVRDEIRHSVDYQINPVTCRASDVLKHRTGYCYAKSHLLAALLRANGILAGFCYQRLSVNDTGPPYSLHGLNGVYLSDIGWYRIDPRGNRPGVDAQFTPPHEQLAFSLHDPEEADFPGVQSEPLPIIVEALQSYTTWDDMLRNLPDVSSQDVATDCYSSSADSTGVGV